MELEPIDNNVYCLKTSLQTLACIRDIIRTILQFSLDLRPEFTNEHIPDVTNADLMALKDILEKAVSSAAPCIVLSGDLRRSFFNVFIELDALPFEARHAGMEQKTYQAISQEVHALLFVSVGKGDV